MSKGCMKYSLKTYFLQIKSAKLSLPYCLISLFAAFLAQAHF